MRKTIGRVAGGAVAAVLALAATVACTSEADEDGGGPASGDWRTTVSQTDFGEVSIDSAPKHIVVLMPFIADIVTSLGVEPEHVQIGGASSLPWLDGVFPGGAVVDNLSDKSALPNLEEIAKLEPDLIIGNTNNIPDQETFDSISSVSKTLALPKQGGSQDASWRGNIRFVANALGKKDEGEKVINGVEDDWRDMGEKYNLAGRTYSFILTMDSRYSVQPGDMFRLLGMKPSAVQGDDSKSVPVAKENAGIIDGDILFVNDGTDGDFMANNLLFDSYPGRKGRTVVLSLQESVAINNKSPLALHWLKGTLDEQLSQITV